MFTYPKFTPKFSIKYETPQIVTKTSHTQNTTLPHVQAVKKYIKGLDIDVKSKTNSNWRKSLTIICRVHPQHLNKNRKK